MSVVGFPIATHFHAASSALPKHARLRQAVVSAIESGDLSAGSKMMGERELSDLLGVSLGTTQKALGNLTKEGFLVRKQGHGTFVGSDRRAITGNWHFRFATQDSDEELPVFASLIERRLIQDEGPWSARLGADGKGYVLLRRRIEVNDKYTCLSQMYLRASQFSKILRMGERRLAETNLKSILESEFGAPTLRSEGRASVVALTGEDAAALRTANGAWGMQLDIVSRGFGHAPISFQRVLIPPMPYALKLDFHPPAT